MDLCGKQSSVRNLPNPNRRGLFHQRWLQYKRAYTVEWSTSWVQNGVHIVWSLLGIKDPWTVPPFNAEAGQSSGRKEYKVDQYVQQRKKKKIWFTLIFPFLPTSWAPQEQSTQGPSTDWTKLAKDTTKHEQMLKSYTPSKTTVLVALIFLEVVQFFCKLYLQRKMPFLLNLHVPRCIIPFLPENHFTNCMCATAGQQIEWVTIYERDY